MNEWMDVICWIVYVNYTLSCPSSWGWELDDDVWLLEVEPACVQVEKNTKNQLSTSCNISIRYTGVIL